VTGVTEADIGTSAPTDRRCPRGTGSATPHRAAAQGPAACAWAVEGLMVPALVAAGAPPGESVYGVLTWRLLQYWLPMPAAGVCWVSLTLSRPPRNS